MTASNRPIRLIGARQNNLKNISVEFPSKKFIVITGLSGSGKSSLAFDTLYAEGQRRYIESLSTYTRQFLEKMPRPDIDSIENLPPTIALEQRNRVMNSRSTVGTQTEIFDYLRLLYAKIGRTSCKSCGHEVNKITPETILDQALAWFINKSSMILAPLLPEDKDAEISQQRAKTLLKIVLEQGFRRLLWKKNSKQTEILDLEELETPTFPKIPSDAFRKNQLFIVIDRLKLGQKPDQETRTRLSDSINQAVTVGRGKLSFADMNSTDWKDFNCRFACTECGLEHKQPVAELFSFNSPLGACHNCSGFGHTLDISETLVVPDPSKTIKNGAIDPLSKPSLEDWQNKMFRFLERHGISIGKRYRELTPAQRKLLWSGDPKDRTFPGILGYFKTLSSKRYKLHVRVFIRRYQTQNLCTLCNGARLSPEALAVRINGQSINHILDMPITDALKWCSNVWKSISAKEQEISRDIILQIEKRLSFLERVGVGYLTLSRLAKTLSGGEFQRIILASQLGNGLCGTLYVLDEPSIGLHAADASRLIKILCDLRDMGNTVVVVEHDLATMRAADYLIELGPGAGKRGGEIIAQGIPSEFEKIPGSLTGKYLSDAFKIERLRPARTPARTFLKITKCRENNLKNISVDFPLERFVIVTGVSGSGKSTLIHKTLYQALNKIFNDSHGLGASGRFDRLYGAENISDVVLLDQKPIGKSSRSNPATYIKSWDEIRRIYANQALSLRRGYTPQFFSFNMDGGRCPVCKGEGEISLDMHFMAEIRIPCDECHGKRFKKNILDITARGKNIHQLLNTTINEVFDLFRDNPILSRKLGTLRDVGLGYLLLGQPATTLSGGESQRLKIASALDSKDSTHVLYIFDEPTTGLHPEDIKKLLAVTQDLVDARHSVIMIEHHLDVIAQADWVIDLGPGGGDAGGELIAACTPGELIKHPVSTTAAMLRAEGYNFPTRDMERSINF